MIKIQKKKLKIKAKITREEQKARDLALSQPKCVRIPRHKLSRQKFTSSVMESYDKISAVSAYQANREELVIETEPEIKMTEFIPTKIFLKKEVKRKAMQAVNHTVTTKSPTGEVISKIKLCSVASDPGSPECLSL